MWLEAELSHQAPDGLESPHAKDRRHNYKGRLLQLPSTTEPLSVGHCFSSSMSFRKQYSCDRWLLPPDLIKVSLSPPHHPIFAKVKIRGKR